MPLFTGMNALIPRMTNSDMLAIAEINNAANTPNRLGKVDASHNEAFILYNLARNISASDVSVNRLTLTTDVSFQNNTLSVLYPDPNDLPHHVVINNTEENIVSEKFVMDLEYSTGGNSSGFTDQFVIVGSSTSKIPSNITLGSNTVSYYDSSLKLDISLNNDIQYTTDKKWKTQFDRNYNKMNYFATINSHINDSCGNYPFTVTEDTVNNVNSLLANDGYYRLVATSGQAPRQYNYAPFTSSTNTLASNGLSAQLNVDYNYDGTEFGMYKIVQSNDSSNQFIFQLLRSEGAVSLVDGSGLPIGLYSGANITKSAIDMSAVTTTVNLLDPSNGSNIVQGFEANITLGANQTGGYVCASNNYFSIDDTKLTTTGTPYNLNYLNNNKAFGRHSVDISNGYVRFNADASLNLSYISLSSDAESLVNGFASVGGSIDISTNKIISKGSRISAATNLGAGKGFTTNERAAFIGKLDVSGVSSGASYSDFTDSVGVFYNSLEYSPIDLPAGHGGFNSNGTLVAATPVTPNTVISNTVASANYVKYDVSVLIESTEPQDISAKYLPANDRRNVCGNTLNPAIVGDVSDSVMVMATSYIPVDFSLNGASFQYQLNGASNKLRAPNKMNILNIKNSDNILSGARIRDSSTNDYLASDCAASFTNYRLSDMSYSDFKINLTTRTVRDISNSVRATNNWTFTTSNLKQADNRYPMDGSGTLIGNPNRASELIHDKATFIGGSTPLPISYTFRIDGATDTSPAIYNDLNVVKYVFDASLTDPTLPVGHQSVLYKFGGSTDTIITDLSINDFKLTSISLSAVTSPIASLQNNININSYIVEQWLRQRSYRSQINPSLPYYENLLLETPLIREEQVYYRIWTTTNGLTKGNELNGSTILGNFVFNNEKLNIVKARLVSGFINGSQSGYNIQNISTNIVLNPSDCCIFKASLTGKDLSSNVWVGLGYTDPSNINQITSNVDPFTIHDSTLVIPITTVNLNISVTDIISSKSYYLQIANSLGTRSAYTATCYSFDINALANLGSNFNPYIADFANLQLQATPVNYICQLEPSGNNFYVLNISHVEGSIIFQDVKVVFPNNYILNFNLINAPNNLLKVVRSIGKSVENITNVTTTYLYETNQSSKYTAKIDEGVYFTHASNVSSGQRESFYLQPDRARISFVNHVDYKFNHPYWCDTSGTMVPIKFSTLNNFLELTNSRPVNGTKSIKLNRVRGYNVPETTGARLSFSRKSASYTFTLDCSNAAPFLPIFHYVSDLCSNIIVSGPKHWVDASSNGIVNYDACSNAILIKDASFSVWVDASGLRPTLNYVSGKTQRAATQRNSVYILDSSNSFMRSYSGYTITTTGVVVPGSSPSPNGFYDVSRNIEDPSYNYTAEQMVYKVTIDSGCGAVSLGNGLDSDSVTQLKSVSAQTPVNGRWLNNKLDSEEFSRLDLGLILNINQSVFADGDYISNYPVQATPADFTYSFSNPVGQFQIRNGSGSGYLSQGIISPFFNFKTRAIKTNIPCNIRLKYTNSIARVYYRPTYDGNPADSTINNWSELATSPFYPNELVNPDGVSLHPTLRLNRKWPVSIRSINQGTPNVPSYMVCAPPVYNLKYNAMGVAVTELPFNQSVESSSHRMNIYLDAKTSLPSYNLRKYGSTENNESVLVDTIVTPIAPLPLALLKYNASAVPSKFDIKSNNITINLWQGLSQPVLKTVYYYDNSLNTIDVSGGLASDLNPRDDSSYNYYVTTETGSLLTETPLYSGPISELLSSTKLSVSKANNTTVYDISFAQSAVGLPGIDINKKNIQFSISNAFLPPVSSYLPLQTGNKTTISFYSSVITYNNGLYDVVLNKYTNNDSNGIPIGYDFNQLFKDNTNIRNMGFNFNKVEQASLYITKSGDVSFNYSVPSLLDTIVPNDVSNVQWSNITKQVINQDANGTPKTLGISYTAYDQAGINALRTIFTYSPNNNLFHKSLYVERDDIMRISNFFGLPVFRITNGGNVITNKVSTTLLSLFNNTTASITASNLVSTLPTNSGVTISAATPSIVAGLPFRNTVDFSGNARQTL